MPPGFNGLLWYALAVSVAVALILSIVLLCLTEQDMILMWRMLYPRRGRPSPVVVQHTMPIHGPDDPRCCLDTIPLDVAQRES